MWIFIIREKIFKILSNFIDKVLKWLNYMDIIFPKSLLHYFMHLQFKFDVYSKKSISDT
jgi:nicotinic acid phosphoribosyltransferase